MTDNNNDAKETESDVPDMDVYRKSKQLLMESGQYNKLLQQLRMELTDNGYLDSLISHLHAVNTGTAFNTIKFDDMLKQANQYVEQNKVDNKVRIETIHKIGDALQE